MAGHPKRGAAWRFEAIDARAGLAFAVWRPDRADDPELPRDGAPCLFFAPPEFQPESVANVAIALSAAHGSFADGLLAGEQEAWFRRPEEIAEFLRRVYVGSSGGDGGDGGGEGPAPVPRPDRPSERPRLDMGGGYIEELEGAVRRFAEARASAQAGEPVAMSWPLPPTRKLADDSIGAALAAGALLTLRELMTTMPVIDDRMPDGEVERAVQWQQDARLLGSFIHALGLHEWLRSECRGDLGNVLRQHRIAWYTDMVHNDPELEPALYHLLFDDGPAVDNEQEGQLAVHHYAHWYSRVWYVTPAAAAEPVELLQKLPLPPEVRGMLPPDLGEEASMFHLLCAFVAQPAAILAKDVHAPTALAIVLFASSCIALPSFHRKASACRQARGNPPMTAMERAHVLRSAGEGAAWLAEHLPQLAFETALEDYIGRALAIRYRMTAAHAEPPAPAWAYAGGEGPGRAS